MKNREELIKKRKMLNEQLSKADACVLLKGFS